MKRTMGCVFFLGLILSAPGFASNCEDGHWIESVSDNGDIVKLEDGSIWEVNAGDAIDSSLWLPMSDIVACDDKLINTDDKEKVSATKIKAATRATPSRKRH